MKLLGLLPFLLSFQVSPIKSTVLPLEENPINEVEDEKDDIEIDQSAMLITVIIVTSIGMTSIGLFYVLKDKNIIK